MALFIGTNGTDRISPTDPLSAGVISDPLNTLPSAADDTIFGFAGDDSLPGGLLAGGGGNDIIFGGAGNDSIVGGMGNDILFGEAGNDTINAGQGNDAASGGDGIDNITGGAGNDNLSGDLGTDRLTGGPDADVLTGGPDADIFVLTTLTDSLVITGNDTITDFLAGTDKIAIGHTIPAGSFNTNGPFSIPGTDDLATDLSGILPPANLLPQGAAQVTISSGTDAGNYVVINDTVAGYDPTTDAVVKLFGGPVLTNTDFIA
jgi:Ca2+-binding RTX toxin-like protein